jgi:hypothetical protein
MLAHVQGDICAEDDECQGRDRNVEDVMERYEIESVGWHPTCRPEHSQL